LVRIAEDPEEPFTISGFSGRDLRSVPLVSFPRRDRASFCSFSSGEPRFDPSLPSHTLPRTSFRRSPFCLNGCQRCDRAPLGPHTGGRVENPRAGAYCQPLFIESSIAAGRGFRHEPRLDGERTVAAPQHFPLSLAMKPVRASGIECGIGKRTGGRSNTLALPGRFPPHSHLLVAFVLVPRDHPLSSTGRFCVRPGSAAPARRFFLASADTLDKIAVKFKDIFTRFLRVHGILGGLRIVINYTQCYEILEVMCKERSQW
jgi:hypothetical protein